jgi:5-formyltetrahydrofolate cyclo-ligase
MSDADDTGRGGGAYASSPCYAHEIAPDYFDPLAVDPAQARDVVRWRKAERQRLLAARQALSVAGSRVVSEALAGHVAALLGDRFPSLAGRVLSAYWPIKGEPDLRAPMAGWHAAGAVVALPVVETRHAPLVFRCWTPGLRMVRGDWNIPVPPTEAETTVPQIAVAPLVGWDDAGYRLGYGGGYFDRTLAALRPRPFVIGIGFQAARLATIYPQPHDIRLDAIVTEAGVQVLREAE